MGFSSCIAWVSPRLNQGSANFGVARIGPELVRSSCLHHRKMLAPQRILGSALQRFMDRSTVSLWVKVLPIALRVMQSNVVSGIHALNICRSIVPAVEIHMAPVRTRDIGIHL